MSKFIKVKEAGYGMELLLNLDNVVAVSKEGNVVYTNTVHGENTGIFHFRNEELQKIVDAIEAQL